jgi:hypothetical protein
VQVQIGFRRGQARADVVDNPGEKRQVLEHFVLQDPKGAEILFGWDPERDDLAKADFSLVIEKVLIVRFRLEKG